MKVVACKLNEKEWADFEALIGGGSASGVMKGWIRAWIKKSRLPSSLPSSSSNSLPSEAGGIQTQADSQGIHGEGSRTKLGELRQMIKGIERKVESEGEVKYPTYYPGGKAYPKGTMVRVKTGRGWEVIEMPEIDGEGNMIKGER